VDSGPPVTREARAAIALVAAAAVIFMVGFIAALVAAVLSLTGPHHAAAVGAPYAVGTAEHIAVVGLAVGMGALVLVWPGFKAAHRTRRPLARQPGPGRPNPAADQEPDQVPDRGHDGQAGAKDWLEPLRPRAAAPPRLADRGPAPHLPWLSDYFEAGWLPDCSDAEWQPDEWQPDDPEVGWRPDFAAEAQPPPAIDLDADDTTGPLPAIRDWFEPPADCEGAPRPEQAASGGLGGGVKPPR
jgi:hypothetical protein